MLEAEILFITPPFTQLNTPYPATPYLKGFLRTLEIESHQVDLSLEVILDLFSSGGLSDLFSCIEELDIRLRPNEKRIFQLKEYYIATIDRAIAYLQGKDQTLAHIICEDHFLPQAGRFSDLEDLEWAFGTMGIHDKARHLITLYLEDLSDLIVATVDPNFGFSRYAEHLGRSASSFDELYLELQKADSYTDRILLKLLEHSLADYQPKVVALTVPFPGNLYSALKCGQYIKAHYKETQVLLGGGFANTELRQLSDARLFDYVDYLFLDDGELPLKQWLEYKDSGDTSILVRTYMRRENTVLYCHNQQLPEIRQRDKGVPDYDDLQLDKYLSVVEMANPMHSLWSNGRWNKLTLAHGCYWGKCAFCDGALDYIGRYEPDVISVVVDRMEYLIEKTGERGFHFVDEAAPPALLKELALEIIRRGLTVVWWTNIRFEKSFTKDLCRLLYRSGCIAVSGGLEVASDRLLKLINKGVSLVQVARVTDHFTEAGIMVHAYLMYGFPSETAQETIDSLEVVRQLFLNGLVQSAFWHRFALTAHSPVGKNPEEYSVQITEPPFGGFARNDLSFKDLAGADPSIFGEGLRKSLYNYMRGVGFDIPLQKWFDKSVPRTLIPPTYIERFLGGEEEKTDGVLKWMGPSPSVRYFERNKKGKQTSVVEFLFCLPVGEVRLQMKPEWGEWLEKQLIRMSPVSAEEVTWRELAADFNERQWGNFDQFLSAGFWNDLRKAGLIII